MSHLRISAKDQFSPLIPEGQCDLLVALEPVEGLRILAYYGNPRVMTLLNTRPIHPMDVISGNATYPRINYNDYDNIEKIIDYLEQVESKANTYLNNITPNELTRKIERKLRDGSTSTVTVEDILIDLFQEETHHRGELIALLWQKDVIPPHVGWSQYLHSSTL
jgi:Pyruvate/2-oxoacid:ferredoxin oxidoreductase gamma subunit